MLVVGGLPANVMGDNVTRDPWDQGFGIFDLASLEWKSSYDPSGSAYETPSIIKNYISEHGQFPAQWDSETLSTWFTEKGSS